jgi:hypothetical protein
MLVRMLHLVRVTLALSFASSVTACQDNASDPAARTQVAAQVIDGQRDVTIRGVSISNPYGNCITIKGNAQNIIIQDSDIGPCGGSGIRINSSANVRIAQVYIHDTTDNGVTAYLGDGLTVTDSRMERVMTGVYALECLRVNVAYNSFLNVQGPAPRGQFVQFDKVKGPGNRIQCNVGRNILGQSSPEDAINLYQSDGDPNDLIQVIGNKIKGGGPSTSGGGILLGDSGGSYQLARDNILVDPGQYGISVASGHDMVILGNSIYGRQQPFTNVGLSVWNQYRPACFSIMAEGNKVNWVNRDGKPNHSWSAGNCGSVAGWNLNTWNAKLDESIFDVDIPACQKGQ